MMLIQLTLALVSLVLAVPATSALRQEAPPPKEVLLHTVPPAANAKATCSFTEESALDVDHLRSTMGDDVFERYAPDRSVKQLAHRVWNDTVLAGTKGPMLRRTFIALDASMQVTNSRRGEPRPDGNAAGTSALVGRTVEFMATGAGDVARFADEETDAEPTVALPAPDLGALTCDSSWQGFLPSEGKAVSVGEEWSVDAAAMLGVFAPGGDIPTYYGPIENQIDPDIVARFGGHAVSRFGSGASGDVRATLLGIESRAGARLALIKVRFDVKLARDPAPWMRAQSAPFEMAKIGQTAKNASHTMQVTGEGTLRWDLDHHRFVDFQAEAETASDQRVDYAFELRGYQYTGHEHFELSGTTKLEFAAEYRER